MMREFGSTGFCSASTELPIDKRGHVIRRRQDLSDVSGFERTMNDRTAGETYEQLWLAALRSGKDPNDSEPEEEYDGYVAPVYDKSRGAVMMTEEFQRIRRINSSRQAVLQRLRANAEHRKKDAFTRLVLESESFHSLGFGASRGEEDADVGASQNSATGCSKRGGKSQGEHESGDDASEGVFASPQCFITETPSYIKGKLRPYQVEGVNWLLSLYNRNVNGILADEMGLGKTFQTIAMLSYLKFTRGLPGPHLVVCPKSVLGNWFREFRHWCPALTVYKFHGDSVVRPALIQLHLKPPLRYDIILTTFDMVLAERNAFQRIPWNYLVVDEAHKLKNNESTAHSVLDGLQTMHRLLITGTPLQNNLSELWALLHFLSPNLFPDSQSFQQWFDASQGIEDKIAVSRMHLILAPIMIRRLKADVSTGIPPKKEIYVGSQLSAKQRSWYLTILSRDADTLNRATGGSASQLNNIVMQLRKVCNHPYLMPGGEEGPPFLTNEDIVRSSGKMVVLDRLLAKLYSDRAANHKVLLFCQMTSMLDIVEDYLNFRGYRYCRIDGNTGSLDRDKQMAAFNNPNSEYFIFLLSTRAGGLGINLQTANHVILYDSDWNPQADLQAQDRAHRIGQKRNLRVYRFIASGTIEERIYKRALKKLYLDAMVVQQSRVAGKMSADGTAGAASKEELLSMIRFGAEEIFKARKADITDEDIDRLLEQGEVEMDRLQSEAKQTTQSSLASFKFGADESNLYDFEGIDYSTEAETKMLLITLNEPMSQDELYEMCSKYGEVNKARLNPNLREAVVHFRTQGGATDCLQRCGLPCAFVTRKNDTIVTTEMVAECLAPPGSEHLGRGQRHAHIYSNLNGKEQEVVSKARERVPQGLLRSLPKKPNYPYYQLFDVPRLVRLHEAECAVITRNYRRRNKAEADGQLASFVEERISQSEQEERERLLADGFPEWAYQDWAAFKSAVTSGTCSLHDYERISTEWFGGTKTAGQVRDYCAAFTERGPFLIPNFERLEEKIRAAEQKVQIKRNTKIAAQWKVETCEHPEEELRFVTGTLQRSGSTVAAPATTGRHETVSRSEEIEFDRRLFLVAVENDLDVEKAVREVKRAPEYQFDIYYRTRSASFLASRLNTLLNAVRREWERATGVAPQTCTDGRSREAVRDRRKRRAEEDANDGGGAQESPLQPDIEAVA